MLPGVSVCPGNNIPLEDFNNYSVLLDMDGNAWSDRFRIFSHFNTPIMKQASNLTAFHEHIMAPGVVVEQFASDLHDLPIRVQQVLEQASSAQQLEMTGTVVCVPHPGSECHMHVRVRI